MARYLTTGGKLYKVSTKEAKRILKSVVKMRKEAPPEAPKADDELAPVIDLDRITPEEAREAYLAIEMED